MSIRHRVLLIFLCLLFLVPLIACTEDGSETADSGNGTASVDEEDLDPVELATELPRRYLVRMWRGVDPQRSEDIIYIPDAPNYQGSFQHPSHNGPWDYVQKVPLVFYGPGIVPDHPGEVDEEVTVADIYPTLGELTGVSLPQRSGRTLDEVVPPNGAIPDLIVVVVWDGGGTNVLERWPDSWPNLKRLAENGVSYSKATVGSSPSITPPVHATLATGAFPRESGISGIHIRHEDGKVRRVFQGVNPTDLELTTAGDEIDLAYDNKSKVGLLAWQLAVIEINNPLQTSNHLSMLGQGSEIPGGDHDDLALLGGKDEVLSNENYFANVPYLDVSPDEETVDALDVSDGESDDTWMGNDILSAHDNPAWVEYQSDQLETMIAREGYGDDDVPDLLFTNFKASDLAGHRWTMDSKEMTGVVEAQDEALGRLVDYLDSTVDDYAVVVTADHGHTPSALRTGAWPLDKAEMAGDINRFFGVPRGSTLLECCSTAGLYLDEDVMQDFDVTVDDVALFLNDYTIEENWPSGEELPAGYEDRGEERILSVALPKADVRDVMMREFGSAAPPKALR